MRNSPLFFHHEQRDLVLPHHIVLLSSDFFDIVDISQIFFFLFQCQILGFQLLDFLFGPHPFLVELEDLESLFRCILEQRQCAYQDHYQESFVELVSGTHLVAFPYPGPEDKRPGIKKQPDTGSIRLLNLPLICLRHP